MKFAERKKKGEYTNLVGEMLLHDHGFQNVQDDSLPIRRSVLATSCRNEKSSSIIVIVFATSNNEGCCAAIST